MLAAGKRKLYSLLHKEEQKELTIPVDVTRGTDYQMMLVRVSSFVPLLLGLKMKHTPDLFLPMAELRPPGKDRCGYLLDSLHF